MRNWKRCCGVYCNMLAVVLFLLCSFAAAQSPPPQDPLDRTIQAIWQARGSGRFADAAAGREQARALLQRAPADSPRFAGWVQQVAGIYQNAGLNAQARGVLREGLDRTAALGSGHPSHIALLGALGDSWQQDGNLLKAVEYLEQAASARAAAPPLAESQPNSAVQIMAVSGKFHGVYRVGGYRGDAVNAYSRLADLYQQLGRPDAAAATATKVRALLSNDEPALARFYERLGQFEEASALYKKLAEQSADAPARANAWQALANLYVGQERYTDAIAAMQQAIAVVQSSERPGMGNQVLWMRQNLAGYLRQAGQLPQADQVYQQLREESRGGPLEVQMLGMYAQYLAETRRGAEGESLLKDHLTAGANLDAQQKINLLFSLSNVARSAGDSAKAEEYQQAGQALQAQSPPPPAGQIRIGDDVQKAEAAVRQHRLEDAYDLALHIVDSAAQAVDGQQVGWLVPQIAQSLAGQHEPAKAEQLFQRLMAFARNRSVDSIQPLIGSAQAYARFLMSQPDRMGDVPSAIEQYRRALIEANGPDSASLTEALRMKIEFARSRSHWAAADDSVRELLELQESLSGNTSEPYLGDLQNAASVYEAAGDSARALTLRRRAIAVADLLAAPNNLWRRALTRMDAALLLARMSQFEEAERLGEEAAALGRIQKTPSPPMVQMLEQIRQMKQMKQIKKPARSGGDF